MDFLWSNGQQPRPVREVATARFTPLASPVASRAADGGQAGPYITLPARSPFTLPLVYYGARKAPATCRLTHPTFCEPQSLLSVCKLLDDLAPCHACDVHRDEMLITADQRSF